MTRYPSSTLFTEGSEHDGNHLSKAFDVRCSLAPTISRKSQCVGTRSRWIWNAGSLSPTCLQRSGESLYEIICHNKHRQTRPLHRLRLLRRFLPTGRPCRWSGTATGEYNPVEVSPCTTECGLWPEGLPLRRLPRRTRIRSGSGLLRSGPGDPAPLRDRLLPRLLRRLLGETPADQLLGRDGDLAPWRPLLAEGIGRPRPLRRPPTGDPERLFTFRVFDTPENVRTGAGSAYYPVEMSEVIRQVLEVPGRYARHRPAMLPQGDPACPAAEQETPGAGRRHRRPHLRAAEEQALHRLRRRSRRGAG